VTTNVAVYVLMFVYSLWHNPLAWC